MTHAITKVLMSPEQLQLTTISVQRETMSRLSNNPDEDAMAEIEILDDIIASLSRHAEQLALAAPADVEVTDELAPDVPVHEVTTVLDLGTVSRDLVNQHGANIIFQGLGTIQVIEPETAEVLAYIKAV